jgi:hypothetical protein
MMALTTATGGNDGARNLYSHDEGRLIIENMGVKTWPGRTRVVRMFGTRYLEEAASEHRKARGNAYGTAYQARSEAIHAEK